eukprot:574786-Pleurochrysis_carterae.AAC.1
MTTCVLGSVDRVGASDLADLIRYDALLDLPVPERSSCTLHPFTPLITPPSTEPFPPPRLQSTSCYSQTFDSPKELLTPRCFKDLQRGWTRFSMTQPPRAMRPLTIIHSDMSRCDYLGILVYEYFGTN